MSLAEPSLNPLTLRRALAIPPWLPPESFHATFEETFSERLAHRAAWSEWFEALQSGDDSQRRSALRKVRALPHPACRTWVPRDNHNNHNLELEWHDPSVMAVVQARANLFDGLSSGMQLHGIMDLDPHKPALTVRDEAGTQSAIRSPALLATCWTTEAARRSFALWTDSQTHTLFWEAFLADPQVLEALAAMQMWARTSPARHFREMFEFFDLVGCAQPPTPALRMLEKTWRENAPDDEAFRAPVERVLRRRLAAALCQDLSPAIAARCPPRM